MKPLDRNTTHARVLAFSLVAVLAQQGAASDQAHSNHTTRASETSAGAGGDAASGPDAVFESRGPVACRSFGPIGSPNDGLVYFTSGAANSPGAGARASRSTSATRRRTP